MSRNIFKSCICQLCKKGNHWQIRDVNLHKKNLSKTLRKNTSQGHRSPVPAWSVCTASAPMEMPWRPSWVHWSAAPAPFSSFVYLRSVMIGTKSRDFNKEKKSKEGCFEGFSPDFDLWRFWKDPKEAIQNAFGQEMLGTLGMVEWVFLTSPRLGTGPAAPHISDGREPAAPERRVESNAITSHYFLYWKKKDEKRRNIRN